MLRAIGKTCFAHAYTWAYAGRALGKRTDVTLQSMPFIVCYHRVVENFARAVKHAIPSMLISTAMFEQHIDWLAKRFSIVALDEIGSHIEFPERFSRPAAAITFDDGYSDVYHHALPILKRKGIPSAVFVVTGLAGTSRPQLFDRLYLVLRCLSSRGAALAPTVSCALLSLGIESPALDALGQKRDDPFGVMTVLLKALPQRDLEKATSMLEKSADISRDAQQEIAPLSWEMITSMHRNGVTIGSHTHAHSLLTSEKFQTACNELCESKRILETKLRTAVEHFAYPDGEFNPAVVEAVKSAGYRYGYGICASRDPQAPLLTIPRKVLWERSCLNAMGRFSSAVMNCQVYRAFEPKDHCEHDHSLVRKAGEYARLH